MGKHWKALQKELFSDLRNHVEVTALITESLIPKALKWGLGT